MPCDSLQTNRVDLAGANLDPSLLALAMAELGLAGRYSHDREKGKVIISGANGQGVTQDQIKQAYSNQVVKATAKKYGWAARVTGENKYQLVKRSI